MAESFDYLVTVANRRIFADLVDEILEDILNHDIRKSGEPMFEGNFLILRIENWDLHHDVKFIEVDGLAMEEESPFWAYSFYQVFCEDGLVVVVKKTAREEDHEIIKQETLDVNKDISEEDRLRLVKAYQDLIERK